MRFGIGRLKGMPIKNCQANFVLLCSAVVIYNPYIYVKWKNFIIFLKKGLCRKSVHIVNVINVHKVVTFP
jgi:hypothetical protein